MSGGGVPVAQEASGIEFGEEERARYPLRISFRLLQRHQPRTAEVGVEVFQHHESATVRHPLAQPSGGADAGSGGHHEARVAPKIAPPESVGGERGEGKAELPLHEIAADLASAISSSQSASAPKNS